jgi:inosose dehydratase
MIGVGTGPDSWGVWFADAPGQVQWPQYLDEAARAGYELTELGPLGYAPRDPAQVAEDLRAHGLTPLASFAEVDLSEPDAAPAILDAVDHVGHFVAAVGGSFVNVIDVAYRDLATGVELGPAELEPRRWRQLTSTCEALGALIRDRYGLVMTFHPHADTHVERADQIERLLDETDPELVSLVFDTGHHAYRGGDPVEFFRAFHGRIAYLHLKNVDPRVRAEVDTRGLPLVEAVKRRVFCEPVLGVVDFPALAAAVADVGFAGPACVEQDMHQPPPGHALGVATRTRVYLREIGLG